MKKQTKIVIVVLGVLALIVVLAYYGVIEIPGIGGQFGESSQGAGDEVIGPAGASDLHFSKTDIFMALQTLAGKPLSYNVVSSYIDALHMTMWGSNTGTADSYLTYYESQYMSWTATGRSATASSNWVAFIEGWYRGSDAKAVIVGEGAAVKAAYGYDVMILTAYGPLTTFYQFYNAMR